MPQRISSLSTLPMKTVPPLLTGGVLVLTAVFAVVDPSALAPGFVIPLTFDLVAFVCFIWLSYKLKFVEVDSQQLYVGGWFKQIAVPLSSLETVDYLFGTRLMPRWVLVRLKSPSAFGSTIYFIPTVGAAIRATLNAPSVVEDLRRMAGETSKPAGAI